MQIEGFSSHVCEQGRGHFNFFREERVLYGFLMFSMKKPLILCQIHIQFANYAPKQQQLT